MSLAAEVPVTPDAAASDHEAIGGAASAASGAASARRFRIAGSRRTYRKGFSTGGLTPRRSPSRLAIFRWRPLLRSRIIYKWTDPVTLRGSTMSLAAEVPVTPDAAKSDHEANGRFAKGNRGGPGNPFTRRVAELRHIILDCLGEEELADIIHAMIEQAKQGDVAAARLLLQYSLGKPAVAVEPDRMHIDEFQIIKDSAVPSAEWLSMLMNTTSAKAATLVSDILWPIIEKEQLRPIIGKHLPNDSDEKRAATTELKRILKHGDIKKPSVSPLANGSNGGPTSDPNEAQAGQNRLGRPDIAASRGLKAGLDASK